MIFHGIPKNNSQLSSGSLPTPVLTVKPRAKTRATEVELGAQRPAQVWFQPMVTWQPQPFVQSAIAPRPPLLSLLPLLPRPFAFPLAPPSLTERKVPSADATPAAIGGRSVAGRPNQSARRDESLDTIGWRGVCPLRPRSSLPAGGSEAGQVGAGPGSRFGCAGAREPEVNTGLVGVGRRAGPGRRL